MNNLFQINTDNVYKFIFIFGLFIMSAAIFEDFTETATITELENKIQIEANNIKYESERVEEKIKIAKELNTKKSVDTKLINENWDKSMNDFYELSKSIENNNFDNVILEKSRKNHQMNHIFYVVVALIGFIISLIGLRQWYCKIQIFQDEKLRLEVAKLKNLNK